METVFAITIIIAGLALLACSAILFHVKVQRDDYRAKWEHAIDPYSRHEATVYEWANRDLIPKWEILYPHVTAMEPIRQYAEWATFCANYPTREQMEDQIGKAPVQ